MKKSTFTLTKITTSFLLCASIILSSTSTISLAATERDEESSFLTLHRVYDTNNDGLWNYHYEDEDGNRVELNTSDSVATNDTSSLKEAANLPASYDLRTVNAVSSIKDQGITGCCWAFAAIKSMESNLALKGITNINSLDLSESHLSWYTYHPSTIEGDPLFEEGPSDTSPFWNSSNEYNEGGNAQLATFVLSRWSGAVSESTAPFTGNTTAEISQMVNSMKQQGESLRYRSDYILTDSVCYDNASLDQIKKVLMTDGAIDLSYYHNSKYYNQTTHSYYQEHVRGSLAIDNANHSVNIIGWDDNYPKENFSPYQPSSDGAWLIANSYGNDFGDSGFSWISYEEPSLTEFYTYCATPADTYDNNYQYDGYGWGIPVKDQNADTTSGANIFTADTDYNQNLTAVGIYTLADNQPYTIKIYRNVTTNKPTSGKLAATISGTKEFQGYHTIPLENAVPLKAGERFSVVISYAQTNNDTGYIPLEGPTWNYFSYKYVFNSHAGESFLYDSNNAKWVDTSVQQAREELKNNICIKAFTKNTTTADTPFDDADDSSNTGKEDNNTQNNNSGNNSSEDSTDSEEKTSTIKFIKESVTLGAGENYSPTVKLTNAANLTVSYESSDSSIATVSNAGKITAKSVGTARIVATLSNGVSSDITVNVKNAPSKITVKPAKKKTIAKKKSFLIKVTLPAGSASNKITYSSSKPSVAKVNAKGKVTGKKKGKAVILVKTYNGKTAKITVTVK